MKIIANRSKDRPQPVENHGQARKHEGPQPLETPKLFEIQGQPKKTQEPNLLKIIKKQRKEQGPKPMGESTKSMPGQAETRQGREINEKNECKKHKERAKQNTQKAR